ncbi:MAG: GatB/YqeY domain-containing protein, partial [Candidatus Omnitrophica bacterium]|nr:GatB/YqeY domain-containing protein [Candidatus Omnitrophota bacterium]
MLEKNINDSMKNAMKSGDKTLLGTLRLIVNEIKNRKI